ncbi:MAG TPA: ribosomal protein S18-alanine N-acetyltransferase [Acidimicrobiales bacterium]|nr:ribosomal protein S18-alanine N-acetyltransferase [Acidimicrobiales bacterium]
MNARRVEAPEELEVVIGPMRRRHLRGVLRIEQQVYPRPWSMGLFMSELGFRSGRVYVVARVDGAVVGYGGLMLVQEDGHVTTLAVDPAWHRHKIGTRLLLRLTDAALERGVKNLTLEVRIGNQPAQELYRRFGFVPAGIRKGYYVETNEDALVMWANDIDMAAHEARLEALAATVDGSTVHEELDR